MSTLGLEKLPGRCVHGFAPEQHNTFCACTTGPASEWSVFTTAIRAAAASSADGLVHQAAVRPRIQAIPPKHRGQLYRRAKAEGLLVDTGEREPSNDVAGRNTDKLDRIYRLVAA